MFQSSDSTNILLSFYVVWFIDPKFGHWKGFKKIYILKVKYYMNRILISENALTKWYLLGSIEFLATLKCLIIICCFLPAEFWQKYVEVSELTGHVRTSGNYGRDQWEWIGLWKVAMIGIYFALWWPTFFFILIWPPSWNKSISTSAYFSWLNRQRLNQ